ncbi:YrdB family protein [Kribbella sp. NPDC051770]|uniref:YrdB family protein n=1 Tax=Kribbella sp. NPDC051770 TaxID=3155413 RepID=UPI00341F3E3F
MRELWRWGNLLVAFLAELVALGIFAWWGWQTADDLAGRLILAIGLPVLAGVLWGLFAAPTATRTTPVVRGVVKTAVFGLAGLALWDVGHPVLGLVFVAVVSANLLAIRVGKLTP